MNETLRAYRDDGPLAEALSFKRSVRVPADVLVALALVALGIGLTVDGAVTATGSLVGAGVFIALGIVSRASPVSSPLAWLVPAALRVGEYAICIVLAWRVGGAAVPAMYGLLAAMAFHHYDIVYRIRHQRVPPPRWLSRLGGGWELRMGVLVLAAWAGVLLPALLAVALWSAVLYVGESAASWIGIARDEHRMVAAGPGEDEEDED